MGTEDTIYEGSLKNESKSENKETSKLHSAVAGITGLGLGAAGTVVIGNITNAYDRIQNEIPEQAQEEIIEQTKPVWAVDDISVATGINDEMSFGEAFASARAEIGPGGAFVWHGTVYGTYTADEWNNMSISERSEYNDHFSWNHVNPSTGNVANKEPIVPTNDIEVVSVQNNGDEAIISNLQPEIEVLGVVHDHTTGSNIGGITVDGQEVFLIDVDGDLEFDIVASDMNHNNIVDPGEVADIHGQGLTVEHLGGFTDPNDAIQASDDYIASNDDFSIQV